MTALELHLWFEGKHESNDDQELKRIGEFVSGYWSAINFEVVEVPGD